MKTTLNILLIALLMAVGKTAAAAESASARSAALVNVVLVQVDTSPEAVEAKRFETGNWTFWDQAAPRLLARLEGDLGRTRATGPIGPEASLYGVRCAAASLDDTQNLKPLVEHLNGISKLTGRPGLLLVWMPNQGSVLLGSLGSENQQADCSLATLARIQPAHARPTFGAVSVSVSPAFVPPCIVASGLNGETAQTKGRSLDQILRDGGMDSLSHVLVLSDLRAAVLRAARISTPTLPPGAEMQIAIHITDWGINQYKDGALKMGDDFSQQGVKSVFETVPKSGQILIVMPPHEQFATISDQDFTKQVYDTIKARVSGGLATGGKEFEIQFIEHIGTLTYFHYCPVIDRAKMPNTPVVIDDYRSLDLLTI